MFRMGNVCVYAFIYEDIVKSFSGENPFQLLLKSLKPTTAEPGR